jgi:hypothetical protein
MNQYKILVATIISLTLASSVRALEPEYNNIDEFIGGISNITVVNKQVVEGDLNEDNRLDKVVLVKSKSDDIAYYQLFVLIQTQNGGLRIAGKSAKVRSGEIDIALKISKGSFFVSVQAIKSIWGTYQFKNRNGGFQIIGLKLHVAEDSGEPDHDITGVVDTDFNLLTGKLLFKRVGDRRVEHANAVGHACPLSDYNFDFFFCTDNWKTKDGQAVDDLMSPK